MMTSVSLGSIPNTVDLVGVLFLLVLLCLRARTWHTHIHTRAHMMTPVSLGSIPYTVDLVTVLFILVLLCLRART